MKVNYKFPSNWAKKYIMTKQENTKKKRLIIDLFGKFLSIYCCLEYNVWRIGECKQPHTYRYRNNILSTHIFKHIFFFTLVKYIEI